MVLTFKAREEEEEEEVAKFIPAPGAVIETKAQGAPHFWNRGCARPCGVFRNLRRTLSSSALARCTFAASAGKIPCGFPSTVAARRKNRPKLANRY